MFTYRTINSDSAPDQTGIAVLTLEVEVTNTDTIPYIGVSVTAASSNDPVSNYGMVALGDLLAGESRTVIGQFRVPAQHIETLTLQVSR